MYNEGHIDFFDIKCVYTICKEGIKLIPIHDKDVGLFKVYADMQKFWICFSDPVDKNCFAFIDRIDSNFGPAVTLIPMFLFQLLNNESISEMKVTGPSIDEVFHPADYFYWKHMAGLENNTDLAYQSEIADTWAFTVDGIPAKVSLQYGEVFDLGIASDMKIHPQLIVSFPETNDREFLVKIYSALVRFVQLTQYNSNVGEWKISLYGKNGNHIGYLSDWGRRGTKREFYNEVKYRYIIPYIGNLLQFAADNTQISLAFLPDAVYRWSRTDFSPSVFLSLYAAFESEYKANKGFYEEASEDHSNIKARILQSIHACSDDNLSDDEKKFVRLAEDRIKDLGNQTGQHRKIKNVMDALKPVLNSSAAHLLVLSRIGTKDGFNEKDRDIIAQKVVGLRSQLSHEYTLYEFDDYQAEYIHFFEILVHAMMLKRAGIDDAGNELMLGLVFGCNFEYMNRFYSLTGEEKQ